MTFCEKLLVLRTRQKMTQTDLANALGVTRQTVYKWESGQSYPEAMTLWQMRLLFDISLDILLDPEANLPKEEETTIPVSQETEETPALTPTQEEEEKDTLKPQREGDNTEEKKKGFFSRFFGR